VRVRERPWTRHREHMVGTSMRRHEEQGSESERTRERDSETAGKRDSERVGKRESERAREQGSEKARE